MSQGTEAGEVSEEPGLMGTFPIPFFKISLSIWNITKPTWVRAHSDSVAEICSKASDRK